MKFKKLFIFTFIVSSSVLLTCRAEGQKTYIFNGKTFDEDCKNQFAKLEKGDQIELVRMSDIYEDKGPFTVTDIQGYTETISGINENVSTQEIILSRPHLGPRICPLVEEHVTLKELKAQGKTVYASDLQTYATQLGFAAVATAVGTIFYIFIPKK